MGSAEGAPALSLAILNFNEAGTIDAAAREASRVLSGIGRPYELLLVDDGSTDGSRQTILGLGRELPHARAVLHPRNLGLGPSIRTCFFAGRGEWRAWFPADLQADLTELPRLVGLLDDCDVLVTHRDARLRQEGWRRKVISASDRTLVSLLFGIRCRDLHWVRFFRRSVLDRMVLTCRSLTIDTEMLAIALKIGARVREAPFPDRRRIHGVAKGARLGNVAASLGDLLALRLRGLQIAPVGATGTRIDGEIQVLAGDGSA